jgi:hypothetical protein
MEGRIAEAYSTTDDKEPDASWKHDVKDTRPPSAIETKIPVVIHYNSLSSYPCCVNKNCQSKVGNTSGPYSLPNKTLFDGKDSVFFALFSPPFAIGSKKKKGKAIVCYCL